ncbi:testis-specific Y-encoded-like protein 2 isoform X2 [Dasypus novemcinctus]|uniref:testis-specific Y-encoded-like protein 2 isoform X2 n=2 Tax=Dasypus novemcinctus TaxID=9361 RepID=UPI0003288E93|nr:testis-specific Y-encoded-like protein 2 isoform X2 [Dasypus novemcinctus]
MARQSRPIASGRGRDLGDWRGGSRALAVRENARAGRWGWGTGRVRPAAPLQVTRSGGRIESKGASAVSMDRPDEEPPTKTRRLSIPEPLQHDPPQQLLRLPLPPPLQRPRLREETEAAQVLADMRGVGLGPTLPPPPPYVILEEGGIRAYFTLGAGGPGWEPAMESGYGGAPPPTGSLETLSTFEASGGSLEIDFQVMEPSSLAGEQALETCSTGGLGSQRLAGPKRKEEAVIVVEEEDEDEKESEKEKKRRRKRRQRKRKKPSKERNAKRMEYILQALENIQLDLEAVNIKAGKAFLRLKRKFIQMRRPFLERRDLIIQHIPGFWVKAFLNHPRVSILINQRDEDIFRYLTNLQVQDLRHISMGYKMKLYFQTNPYFTNMVIVKEFQRNCSGQLVSHSTPIRWHRGQEPQAHRHKDQDTSHSFFSWFSNHSIPEADKIAEIIKNDLWVNPLRYYMMGEEGYRTNRKKQEEKESKTKDKCEVVIVEDSDDYQAVEGSISETSDSDENTSNETIRDIKISDFMETMDYFETTGNEITDISESLCDSESPDHNESPDDSETTDNNESADDETTDNNESANDSGTPNDNENPDDNSENPEDSNKNIDDNDEDPDDNNENPDNNNKNDNDNNENPSGDSENREGSNQGSNGNNQGSSDSDNEGDYEGSEDEDNDGSEGDNEGSDDDGNEGDNEGSDDDYRDIENYENDIEDTDNDQDDNSNNQDDEDEVEGISEDESVEEEDNKGNEEASHCSLFTRECTLGNAKEESHMGV